MSLLLLALASGNTVSAGQMTASWTWTETHLELAVAAPTTGWVAVGLNDQQDLANSRLVIAAVGPGGAVAEEHVPRPPAHPKVANLEVIEAAESDGWTRIRVIVPLDAPRDDAPHITPNGRVWLTLAWSHDDDFDHHSAMRTASWVQLTRK